MKINRDLIWDYQFTPQQMQSQEFKQWYVGRVLMRGSSQDVRNVGFETIRETLPHLSLPKDIRDFWQWYFER